MIGRNSSASSSLDKRGGRLGIDALEQARQHLLLDAVDRGLEAFVLGRALLARLRLAIGETGHGVVVIAAQRGGDGAVDVEALGLDRRKLGAALVRRLAAAPAQDPSSAGRCRSSAGPRRLVPLRRPKALIWSFNPYWPLAGVPGSKGE